MNIRVWFIYNFLVKLSIYLDLPLSFLNWFMIRDLRNLMKPIRHLEDVEK